MKQNFFRKDTLENLQIVPPAYNEIVQVEDEKKFAFLFRKKLTFFAPLIENGGGITVRDWDRTFSKVQVGENSIDFTTSINEYGVGVSGPFSFGVGVDNILSGSSSLVSGGNNNLEGNYSVVQGQDNISLSDYSFVLGKGNDVSNIFSFVFGVDNIVSGSNVTVIGSQSVVDSDHSFIIGENNQSSKDETYIFGKGLKTENSSVALGKYNKDEEDSFFEIGIGDESQRKNALEIKTNGVLITPESSITDIEEGSEKSLVTKEYIERRISIETIIAKFILPNSPGYSYEIACDTIHSDISGVFLNGIRIQADKYTVDTLNDRFIINFSNITFDELDVLEIYVNEVQI